MNTRLDCTCDWSTDIKCEFCKKVAEMEKRITEHNLKFPFVDDEKKSKFTKWLESKKSGVVAIIGVLTTVIALIDNIIKWLS